MNVNTAYPGRKTSVVSIDIQLFKQLKTKTTRRFIDYQFIEGDGILQFTQQLKHIIMLKNAFSSLLFQFYFFSPYLVRFLCIQ